jgi:hypothetical protein
VEEGWIEPKCGNAVVCVISAHGRVYFLVSLLAASKDPQIILVNIGVMIKMQHSSPSA